MSVVRIIVLFALFLGLSIAKNDKPETISPILKNQKSETNGPYYIKTEYEYNYFEAWRECSLQNKTLLRIDSQQKQDEINIFMDSQYPNKPKPLIYIGGYDLAKPPQYQWVATGKTFNYTNWAEYEPNNYDENENCVHIGLYENGKWNDINCEVKIGFMCE